MSRFSRVTQKIFGSGAGPSQIAQFGSLFAGAPAFTTNVATAQSLSNWLTGWFGAAIGGNAPAIEDMNAVMYVLTSQIAYLMQSGIPEWDSGTTYYTGQTVSDSSGLQYVSIVDTNLNHAVSDTTKWLKIGGRAMSLLGDLLFGTTGGNLAVLPGNITTIPNVLAQTGTGSISAAPAWVPINSLSTSPTVQVLTSASSTYTTPTGVKWLRVRMVGGGGGGAGSSNTVSGYNGAPGTTGANTTFGTATAHGGGGAGIVGNMSANGGAGGTASLGSGMAGIALVGGGGGGGLSGGISGSLFSAGIGGSSPFGGAGAGSPSAVVGPAGASGTGSGGGGAATINANGTSGGGGGSGGYIDAIIAAPAGSYAYGVGDGGAGGVGTASTGGKGGSGTIIVEEFYQ